jgi:hypothetical protein
MEFAEAPKKASEIACNDLVRLLRKFEIKLYVSLYRFTEKATFQRVQVFYTDSKSRQTMS